MDSDKRKKRKAAKQRRRAKLLARHGSPSATVTNYGNNGEVQHMGVVVHRGDQIIASRVYHAADFSSEEQMCEAVLAFASAHGNPTLHISEELYPAQYNEQGELLLNVADELPRMSPEEHADGMRVMKALMAFDPLLCRQALAGEEWDWDRAAAVLEKLGESQPGIRWAVVGEENGQRVVSVYDDIRDAAEASDPYRELLAACKVGEGKLYLSLGGKWVGMEASLL